MCAKHLKMGSTCKVVKVDSGHRASKKLTEMGVVPNSIMKVEAVAPMGDPYLICVRGYNLAIRRRDLEALEVNILEDWMES